MENEYRTRDLYEAAYLTAKGLQLLRVDRVLDSPRRHFVFDGSAKCKVLITEFWNKLGVVDPKTYAEAIRNLKDRLYAGV